MSRYLIFVFLLSLLAPAVGEAQESTLLPQSRLSITPIFGYRVGHTLKGQLAVSGEGLIDPVFFDVEETRGGASTFGVQIDVRTLGPLSVTGSLVRSNPGTVAIPFFDEQQRPAPEVWLAKAGLSLRLPDPTPDSRSFHPAAFVTVAPAVVRETFDPWLPSTQTETVDHFALSVGGEVVTALGIRGVALQLGVEDYITFRNMTRREDIESRNLSREFDEALVADFIYDPTHLIMLRAGLSFRFF